MNILNKNARESQMKPFRKYNGFVYASEQTNTPQNSNVKSMNYSDLKGDKRESFPLHTAVAINDIDRLKQLISSGIDVNERSGCGDTALILSAKKGNFEAAQILISAGADVNAADNYKQSALYYAVTKYSIASPYNKRNEDYPDMAALLITKGAVSTPIRIDSDFFTKTVKTLAVKHEWLAKEFLKKEFHREMFHTNTDFIKKHVKDFLADKDPKRGLTKALEGLINIDFRYENKIEATTHLAHLNSWTGTVVDYDHQLDAEGWLMNRYPPLKVKNLLIGLRDIYDDKLDTQKVFNEPKNSIMNKIVSEIESQLTTYYTQVNQNVIKALGYKNIKEAAINEEVKMVCNKIFDLSPGKEFAIASGFPGHAIYIGFRKSDDGSISRRVYNLGSGILERQVLSAKGSSSMIKNERDSNNGIKYNHVFSKTGRIFPDTIEEISIEKFKNEQGEGAKYIKGVIEVKLGMRKEYLPHIYDDAKNLGGKRITEHFSSPAQKRQLAGNCVLKNNNAAIRNRLDNDALFKWLKASEMKEALRVSDCYAVSEKEQEKDILSLTYVVKEHGRTKDIKACVDNFNTFFRKRFPLSQKNHSNAENELTDFIKTNRDNPKFKDFLNVDGVRKLVNSILQEKCFGR